MQNFWKELKTRNKKMYERVEENKKNIINRNSKKNWKFTKTRMVRNDNRVLLIERQASAKMRKERTVSRGKLVKERAHRRLQNSVLKAFFSNLHTFLFFAWISFFFFFLKVWYFPLFFFVFFFGLLPDVWG